MPTPKIFESEYRFCLLLWEREPIGSGELAKLCEQQLGWKKSTTYTVIKRLAERARRKSSAPRAANSLTAPSAAHCRDS